MAEKGIVYCLTNPAMPGLVKIGSTSGNTKADLNKRIKHLSAATGVPTKFVAYYAVYVSGYKTRERGLHKTFNSTRYNPSKEFFKVAAEDVRAAMEVVMPGTEIYPRGKSGKSKQGSDDTVLVKQRRGKRQWKFGEIGIPKGTTLTLKQDPTITAIVTGESEVEFEGQRCKPAKAAEIALKRKGYNWQSYSAIYNWKYNGETIAEIRDRKLAEAESGEDEE